ncbi:MAG: hypothetical protein GF307_13505, partial [candidate division Zixibacteria bacterium]|nr:hypothetical protein [candidate division Zixibacteria bacterium]
MLKSHRLTLLFIIGVTLVVIWGCAENNPNTTPEVYAPVYPDSLYRNSGAYYIGVTVRDPQGLLDINLVEYRIAHPATADTGRWIEIIDGGSSGDALAGDGIYGTLVQEFGTDAASGDYVLYFRAFDNDNHSSNTLQQTMVLRDDNIPLLSDPLLADSIFADVVDTLSDSLQVRVTVSHPDSSASINEVWFEIYDPAETGGETSYDMFDDGTTGGDSTAGDGRYALRIPVTAVVRDSLQGFFRFEFNANDNRGASALPVDKYLFVLNND